MTLNLCNILVLAGKMLIKLKDILIKPLLEEIFTHHKSQRDLIFVMFSLKLYKVCFSRAKNTLYPNILSDSFASFSDPHTVRLEWAPVAHYVKVERPFL